MTAPRRPPLSVYGTAILAASKRRHLARLTAEIERVAQRGAARRAAEQTRASDRRPAA